MASTTNTFQIDPSRFRTWADKLFESAYGLQCQDAFLDVLKLWFGGRNHKLGRQPSPTRTPSHCLLPAMNLVGC